MAKSGLFVADKLDDKDTKRDLKDVKLDIKKLIYRQENFESYARPQIGQSLADYPEGS